MVDLLVHNFLLQRIVQMQHDFSNKFNSSCEATERLPIAFKLTSGDTIRFAFSEKSSVQVRVIACSVNNLH